MPNGLLNLNKPAGMTSRQAVDLVLRWARPCKAGHAGTLDPLATGVLVVGVGAATRLVEHVQRMTKVYVGTFLLGRRSPTEDVEGEVAELDNPPVPTPEQLAAAAAGLTGLIRQRPPDYSALKVGGRRAYDLARKGRPVELQPRAVSVYQVDILRYEYPELVLRIECGSGTYVRSLGRDLAESLGTAAVMAALVRTAIGLFRLEDAVEVQHLTAEDWAGKLRPMADAVPGLPRVVLAAEEIARLRKGLAIRRPPPWPAGPEVAAFDAAGGLVAILGPRGDGLLGPLRNLTDG